MNATVTSTTTSFCTTITVRVGGRVVAESGVVPRGTAAVQWAEARGFEVTRHNGRRV